MTTKEWLLESHHRGPLEPFQFHCVHPSNPSSRSNVLVSRVTSPTWDSHNPQSNSLTSVQKYFNFCFCSQLIRNITVVKCVWSSVLVSTHIVTYEEEKTFKNSMCHRVFLMYHCLFSHHTDIRIHKYHSENGRVICILIQMIRFVLCSLVVVVVLVFYTMVLVHGNSLFINSSPKIFLSRLGGMCL